MEGDRVVMNTLEFAKTQVEVNKGKPREAMWKEIVEALENKNGSNYLIEEEKKRISTLDNALDSLDALYEDFTVEEYKAVNDTYKMLEDKMCEHEQKIEILRQRLIEAYKNPCGWRKK